MKSSVLNKQGTIWAKSDVLWTIKFTRNISKNNKQYILRASIWSSISKLHGWFYHTSQDCYSVLEPLYIFLSFFSFYLFSLILFLFLFCFVFVFVLFSG